MQSGLARLVPAGTHTRSGLLSSLADQGATAEVILPVGLVEAWLELTTWDDVSRRSLLSAHLLQCTQARSEYDPRKSSVKIDP